MKAFDFADLTRRRFQDLAARTGFEEREPGSQGPDAVLYEADASQFVLAHPHLHIAGGTTCVDLWVVREPGIAELSVSLEGIDLARWLRTTGDFSLLQDLGSPDINVALGAAVEGVERLLSSAGRFKRS